MKTKIPILIIFGIFVSGCTNSDSSPSSLSPYIDYVCGATDSPYCTAQANGTRLYMGLTDVEPFDCVAQLINLPQSLFIPTFNYSGQSTANFNGTYLEGVVTSWRNSSSGAAMTIPNQDFTLCAFLDFNSNGQLDYSEVYIQTTINPSEDFNPLSQWQLP